MLGPRARGPLLSRCRPPHPQNPSVPPSVSGPLSSLSRFSAPASSSPESSPFSSTSHLPASSHRRRQGIIGSFFLFHLYFLLHRRRHLNIQFGVVAPGFCRSSFFSVTSQRSQHRQPSWLPQCDQRPSEPAALACAAERAKLNASTKTGALLARTAQRDFTSAISHPSR